MTSGGSAAPRRARRTQEERSAETRARVTTAAAECLAETGLKGATMSAIAKRAGVTWGAMQHHFGGKDAILDAVLTSSLAELEEGLADLAVQEPDLAGRVRSFVRKAGELLHGPAYRAFVEVQLCRAREQSQGSITDEAWTQQIEGTLSRIWKRAFGDLQIAPGRLRSARRVTFVVLGGISAEMMLFPSADYSRQHLRTLEENLLRMLGEAE